MKNKAANVSTRCVNKKNPVKTAKDLYNLVKDEMPSIVPFYFVTGDFDEISQYLKKRFELAKRVSGCRNDTQKMLVSISVKSNHPVFLSHK